MLTSRLFAIVLLASTSGWAQLPAQPQPDRFGQASPGGKATVAPPAIIRSARLWLDADDSSTFVQTDGLVSQWNDKSPNSFHLTQKDPEHQPTTGTVKINGRNALSFDGEGDGLRRLYSVSNALPLAANDDAYTYYAVWRPATGSMMEIYGQIGEKFRVSKRAGLFVYEDSYGFVGQANDNYYLARCAPNVLRVTCMEVNNVYFDRTNNIRLNDNGREILGRTPAPESLEVGAWGISVGKNANGGGEMFHGAIAEVVVFDSILSTKDRKAMLDYLNAKWGGAPATPAPTLAQTAPGANPFLPTPATPPAPTLSPTTPPAPITPIAPSAPLPSPTQRKPLSPLFPDVNPPEPAPAVTTPVSSGTSTDLSNTIPNTLTAEESAQGWKLLFDGKRLIGLRGVQKGDPISAGWKIQNGELNLPKEIREMDKATGGDLATIEQFWDFEFRFEWKSTASANSGIRYLVNPALGQSPSGLEFQIVDDVHNSTSLRGGLLRRSGALDNILPVGPNAKLRVADPMNKIGDPWNEGKIVVRGNNVEHWMNGEKVLEFVLSPTLRTTADRNFNREEPFAQRPHATFGTKAKTSIVIMDQGLEVAFRNLKVRALAPQVAAPTAPRPGTPATPTAGQPTTTAPNPFLIPPKR